MTSLEAKLRGRETRLDIVPLVGKEYDFALVSPEGETVGWLCQPTNGIYKQAIINADLEIGTVVVNGTGNIVIDVENNRILSIAFQFGAEGEENDFGINEYLEDFALLMSKERFRDIPEALKQKIRESFKAGAKANASARAE